MKALSAGGREPIGDLAQLEVGGAEALAPFGYAVRLVDREMAGADGRQEVEDAFRSQALRIRDDNLRFPPLDRGFRGAALLGRLAAAE